MGGILRLDSSRLSISRNRRGRETQVGLGLADPRLLRRLSRGPERRAARRIGPRRADGIVVEWHEWTEGIWNELGQSISTLIQQDTVEVETVNGYIKSQLNHIKLQPCEPFRLNMDREC